jgi:hypothetical protein
MIRIYYHIYAIEGVESIINEQLTLIKKCINQPYSLTIGISVSEINYQIKPYLTIYKYIKLPLFYIRHIYRCTFKYKL